MNKSKVVGPPIELMFEEVDSIEKALTLLSKAQASRRVVDRHYVTCCLRLSYNELTSLSGISRIIPMIVTPGQKLLWLDVSFNQLARFDTSAVAEGLDSLKILYLHGNRLENLAEVISACALIPALHSLTLNDNLFTEDYHSFTISSLPMLTSLDHTRISKDDKDMSNRKRSNNHD